MHIAIISPFPPAITGVGQYGYYITRALAKSGAFSRVTVLAGAQADADKPDHLGITEVDYCWAPGQLNASQVIRSRVTRLKPDLVWLNLRVGMFGESPWSSIAGLFTPMLVRRMGYPTVVTFHEMVEHSDLRTLKAPGGPFAPLGARLVTDIATQADVICLTMRHHLDRFNRERPHLDCIHIPHGAFHEPLLLDEHDEAELLFFGMLAPFKGIELLLDVFPALKSEYPHLRLTIAGEEHPRFPGYAQSVRERLSDVEGIRWLGKIPDDEVAHLFRRAMVVVLPYTASTGSSSVLYRAATWGRAVAVSDLTEMRLLAKEGNFKVEFFENGNAASLCEAIRDLLASPARRQAQTQHNFSAIQNARIELTCRRYLQAFNRALEKRQSPKRIPIPHIEIEPA